MIQRNITTGRVRLTRASHNTILCFTVMHKHIQLLTSDIEFVNKSGIVSVVMSPKHAIWNQREIREYMTTIPLLLHKGNQHKHICSICFIRYFTYTLRTFLSPRMTGWRELMSPERRESSTIM